MIRAISRAQDSNLTLVSPLLLAETVLRTPAICYVALLRSLMQIVGYNRVSMENSYTLPMRNGSIQAPLCRDNQLRITRRGFIKLPSLLSPWSLTT